MGRRGKLVRFRNINQAFQPLYLLLLLSSSIMIHTNVAAAQLFISKPKTHFQLFILTMRCITNRQFLYSFQSYLFYSSICSEIVLLRSNIFIGNLWVIQFNHFRNGYWFLSISLSSFRVPNSSYLFIAVRLVCHRPSCAKLALTTLQMLF